MKLFISVAIFLSAMVGQGWACSCAPQTPQAHFDQADVVFIGKVLEVNSSWGQQEVELKIIEIQKTTEDDDEDKLTVYTALNEDTCGYFFEKGGVYQIFGNWEDDRLVTNLCSGNQRLKRLE